MAGVIRDAEVVGSGNRADYDTYQAFNAEGFRFRPDGTQPCAGDPEAFFLPHAEGAKAAAEACKRCPFMVPCRLEGLERGEYGIWGGLSHGARGRMTAKERTAEMRRLRFVLAQESQRKRSA